MDKLPDTATGDALRRLVEYGSDLSQPMDIDFFVAVPSAEAGAGVAEAAANRGFATSVEQDEDTGEWTCYCSRTLIADAAELDRLEAELNELAAPFGGAAEGFGSFGNAPDNGEHEHEHDHPHAHD